MLCFKVRTVSEGLRFGYLPAAFEVVVWRTYRKEFTFFSSDGDMGRLVGLSASLGVLRAEDITRVIRWLSREVLGLEPR